MKPKASDVQSEQQQPAIAPYAPTPHALIPAKHKAAIRNNISRKLKSALDLMVFGPIDGEDAGHALSFADAARAADFDVSAMRKALERPHVRAYLKAQKEVFRASASAQNISRAVEIRDQSDNAMARVAAIKLIEGMSDDNAPANAQSAPGMVIVVVNQAPGGSTSATVEHKPMQIIDNATGLNRE